MLKDFTLKDIAKRLYLFYPQGWSEEPTWDDAPDVAIEDQVSTNLKATLEALAAGWKSSTTSTTGFYDILTYAERQSRLNTATGFWLDFLAMDFTDGGLTRNHKETDNKFRRRLQIEILRQKGTRCALACGIANLTGYPATIIEPLNPGDCGAYAMPGDTVVGPSGYGIAGAYGSLTTPFQLFVTAIRPLGSGIPNVGGYSMSTWGYSTLGGSSWGYYGSGLPPNFGNGQYADLDEIGGDVTDAEIYQNIHESMPAGTIAWTNITDDIPTPSIFGTGMLNINFYLDYTTLGSVTIVPPVASAASIPLVFGIVSLMNLAISTASMEVVFTSSAALTRSVELGATIPFVINTKSVFAPFPFGVSIPFEINVNASLQTVAYLGAGVPPPFIMGQSMLMPPGGKLGRTFILGAGMSKIGAGLYGY